MTYQARFQCTNCCKVYLKHVIKGTTKNEFVKTKLCPNCLTASWIPI